MKAFYFHIHTLLCCLSTLLASEAFAASASASPGNVPTETIAGFAPNSVLSEGRWARVRVEAEGMTLISEATIRALGFDDPSKVNVYGIGGRPLPNFLSPHDTDDLPLLPCVRTQKGIVFYATNHVTWQKANVLPFTHTVNPYSHANYYFLSDRPVDAQAMPPAADTSKASAVGEVSTFTARLLHEQELAHVGEHGAVWLGEDFRAQKSQTFLFPLVDAASDAARVNVRFGAHTSGGSGSSMLLSANGSRLPATSADRIPVSSGSAYMQSSSKEISGLSGELKLGIDYSYTGTLFQARLDYIEVFYEKKMRMRDGELSFYGCFSPGSLITLSDVTPDTRIWDVTDPARPRLVETAIQGSLTSFYVNSSGYKEFVAFSPEKVSRTALADGKVGSVVCRNIHALPIPDMVIITLPEYADAARRIAALHEKTDGMTVHVVEPQEVYNEFSGGKPDFNAFRRMLKMWYERGKAAPDEKHRIGYALFMGRPSYDNKQISLTAARLGYNPMIIYQSEHTTNSDLKEVNTFCNDDIIGMLEYFSGTPSEYKWDKQILNVAVGRVPCSSTAEANAYADKLEKYVLEPEYGSWRSKVMTIADDDDRNDHLKQGFNNYEAMISNGNGGSFVYDRINLDTYQRVQTGIGVTYPQATARMLKNYNDGVIFTNYVGHANPSSWGHEHLWEWNDICAMTNRRLTFIYASTCRFSHWDLPSRSGGEVVLLTPDAGAVGLISASRTVYVDPNGRLNVAISGELFKRDDDGRARRLGDVYLKGKNLVKDPNTLRFNFIGDPALRLPSPDYAVRISRIDGVDVTNASESSAGLPELAPCSSVKVEGVITPLGSSEPEADFNGTISLQLFDADRVLTTLGQGSTGWPMSYNDLGVSLSTATAKVADGHFTATLRVPPEISGNYAPASIASYAYDGHGREANGMCRKLRVYGEADSQSPDTEGPVVEKFYANNEGNGQGAIVAPNAILFARLRDESGINVSEGGIGHSLTLTIDGTDIRSDLNSYFVQDADDPDCGTLKYPLRDLAGGRHQLELSVWDNANNNTRAQLTLNVGAAVDPCIQTLTTDVNPASDAVNFLLTLDRPETRMSVSIGVYSLDGRKVWESGEQQLSTDTDSRLSIRWNLCDANGMRVPRGIYIYRARVETAEGTYTSRSQRLAVTAP